MCDREITMRFRTAASARGLRVQLHRVADEGGAPAVAPLATAAERSLRSGFGAERFLLVVARWPD